MNDEKKTPAILVNNALFLIGECFASLEAERNSLEVRAEIAEAKCLMLTEKIEAARTFIDDPDSNILDSLNLASGVLKNV